VTSNDYREQYDRMIRWFNKLQDINQRKRLVDAPREEIMDELAAFFQNCYHLKDWIKHDSITEAKLASSRINIEHFIKNDEDMKLLADLCNGSKHMELDIDPRTGILGKSGENPKCTSEQHFKATFEVDGTNKNEVDWHIKTDVGKEYSVIQLANRCIQKWDDFIRTYLT
jgi:hypothetical protein